MKIKHTLKKVFALVLCISISLCLIPAKAAANNSISEQAVEVVSLREENVKHFDMGDGTYQAIAYSHPVHEMDSDGNWQDIDFSMNLTQTRGISAYTNSTGIALAANYITNQPLLTLTDDDASIAMTLVQDNTLTMTTQSTASITTVAAERTSTQTQIQTFEDAQTASFSNTLLYENVMPGIDLEYIVDPWMVKENIIVNQPATQYAYCFKFDFDGLYPVLQENGSILIYNNATDEAAYEIPAPYMYDAIGEMSFDVNYHLSGSNGTYYLTVTADSDWINAHEREFPVIIDPTVTVHQNTNMDTYINQDTPNEARGGYKFFFVGENEVAYLYTPTPELPELATIDEAELLLYYFYKDHIKTGYVSFSAHLVTDFYWAEESLKWSDVVGADYETYDNYRFGLSSNTLGTSSVSATLSATSSTPKPVVIDVTDALDAWCHDGIINRGVGLRYVTSSPNKSVMFRSTEGHTAYRPKWVYSYSLPYDPNTLFTANLTIQYDHAYSQCYNAQSRIEGEADSLKTFFLREYGIYVNCGNISEFLSYPEVNGCSLNGADHCPCNSRFCVNEDSETNHHTNIYQILYETVDLNNSGFILSYTGWPTCDERSHPTMIAGLAIPDFRVMAITNPALNNIDLETVTAIHEMGHMFGIQDHYDKDTDGDSNLTTLQAIDKYNDHGYNDICLYGPQGQNAADVGSIVICQGCRNRVEEWKNAHGS